jgi:hypothetical protein
MVLSPTELMKKSRQEFSTADYMKTINLPVTNDRTMLLNILNHADNAVLLAITAFLTHEKLNRNLRVLPVSDELIRKIFFDDYSRHLQVTSEEKKLLAELNAIIKAHKRKEIELQRGEDYIIISDDYKTISVNPASIIKYLSIVQAFINKLEGMLR